MTQPERSYCATCGHEIDEHAGQFELLLCWDARIFAKAYVRELAPGKVTFELEPTLWQMRDSDIEMHCELMRERRGVFSRDSRFDVVINAPTGSK